MKWMERLLPESFLSSRDLLVKAKLLGLLNGATTIVLGLVTLNEAMSFSSWYSFALRVFVLFLMGMSLVLLFMAENYKASANFFLAAISMELFPSIILASKPLIVNIYWFPIIPLIAVLLASRRSALVWSMISILAVFLHFARNLGFGFDFAMETMSSRQSVFAENVLRYVAFFFISLGYSFFSKPKSSYFLQAFTLVVLFTGLNMMEINPWSVFMWIPLFIPLIYMKGLSWIQLSVLYIVPIAGLLAMNHFFQVNMQPYPYSFHIYYYQALVVLVFILLSMLLAFRFNLLANQSDTIDDGATRSDKQQSDSNSGSPAVE